MSVIMGDCYEKMQGLGTESVDLIYLDPPFFTQKTHTLKTRDNTKEFSFEDTWDSLKDYLDFIKKRLAECHRVLKSTGSIFLHCDKTASHYLRVLLDEVFNMNNFRSEIIWSYKRWSNSKKGLLSSHQTIYFYSKTEDFKFNTIFTDYSPTTNIDQILQDRVRDENGKSVYKRDEEGQVIQGKEKKGVPLTDVWNIPYLNPKAKERTGYPTQKPILLLEQIIKIVTDENDTVFDPFCGSGTTLVAAKILKRKFIGIDISSDAISLTNQRLEQPVRTDSLLLQKGEEKYIGRTDDEIAILKSIDAFPVQRNSGIDGFLKVNYLGKPISVRIQKQNELLDDAKQKLIKSSKSKGCLLMVLIRTQLDYNLVELFDNSAENNILVINSYDVSLKEWIENFEKTLSDVSP
ncbi:site-specific DNA-methyltransferase [Paenibacillus odorifer]|uniref:DNA-methyltransferase n=1 Tax=Paenibacillus TaxID=44249 RepID=UPI00096E9EA7|nr:site-specific DNA-methyltransferase [Paenibacillus odorifer]OMD88329.1 site-specific DNA-methyltransferase [Paenibacillus odorifer]